jgi:hypothetical protein
MTQELDARICSFVGVRCKVTRGINDIILGRIGCEVTRGVNDIIGWG